MTDDPRPALRRLITHRRAELASLETTLAILDREAGVAPGTVVPGSAPVRRPAARTKLVLEILAEAGDRGMTRAELAETLGEPSPQGRDLLSNGLAYLKRNGRVARRESDGRWHLPA